MHSYDARQAATTALPAQFPADEIGLMTSEEFLHFRNPKDEHHRNDAYDWDLLQMNRDMTFSVGQAWGLHNKRYDISKSSEGYRILDDQTQKLMGLVHDGIGYYQNTSFGADFPTDYYSGHGVNEKQLELGVRSTKRVKYLSEYLPLVSPIAKLNHAKYPVVLQHLIVKGEPMVVRAEKTPVKNKHTSLAIFNQDGQIVAQAQDEWGATLFAVAREYRGKGLGQLVGRYWYEYNPASKSGGFTSSGQANALALWRDRVREFQHNGWYSQLVREGRITYERVKAIVKGVGLRPPPKPQAEQDTKVKIKPTGDILVFCDDISVIVYDRAFLDEQDDRFIHGFGFLRDAHPVGTFLFRLEYERPYQELTTRCALEMARRNGDKLYDGGGYNDLIENPERYPGVVKEGDYLVMTRELAPLRRWAAKERRLRSAVDPYEEKFYSLVELANSKWD